MTQQEQSGSASRLAAAVRLSLEFRTAGRRDVADFLTAHEDLRELLEGLLSDPDGTLDPLDVPAPLEPPWPAFTDYTIEREVGRGGMGVVYAAIQRSLGRRVALKVLSTPMHGHERALWRFQRESRVLARLEHRGIVRVLDAGTSSGTPFFAMEFVAGAPLSTVIEAVRRHGLATATGATVRAAVVGAIALEPSSTAPTAWTHVGYVEAIVDLCAQVADALAFAHAAGIVHRDVKPSNVLVQHDGRAVLSDFGIARQDGGPALTVTGDFAGTPYYVSPEQARRATVDHRTDIFSLGVMLYELLTLQRPFAGDDTSAVLDAIVSHEPPDARRLNPAITSDLAAVVHKALTKEPPHRYAGAGEVAADLRAVLLRQPVRARRPSVLRRLRHWGKREPWRATALATALVGAVALAWLSISFTSSLIAEGERTKAALADAGNARARAEANLDAAVAAVDEMLTQVGERDLADVPQMEPVRRQLLRRALAFYEDFAVQRAGDSSMTLRLAVARDRVAGIRRLLGEDQAAVVAGEAALVALDELRSTAPNDAAVLQARAMAQLNLGTAQANLGNTDAARTLMVQAATTLATLNDKTADEPARRQKLGQALFARAQLEQTREPEVALGLLASAIEEFDRCGDARRPAEQRTTARIVWATLALGRGDLAGAEDAFARAQHEADELVEQDPTRFLVRRMACQLPAQLAIMYKDAGRLEAAEAAARTAVQRWQALVEDYPHVPNSRALFGRSLTNLGNIQRFLNLIDDAVTSTQRAVNVCERLVAEFPATAEYASDLARALANLGSMLVRREDEQDFDAGERALQRAIDLGERLRRDEPGNNEYARSLGDAIGERAFALGARDDLSGAAAAYTRAAQVYADLAARHPEVLMFRDANANMLRGLADVTLATGDAENALTTIGTSLEHLRQTLAIDPRHPARRRFARLALDIHVRAWAALGDHRRAADAFDEFARLIDTAEDAADGAALAVQQSEQAPPGSARDTYAVRAIAILRSAVELNVAGARSLLADPRFVGLRERAEFRALQRLIAQ